jgi:hypothetical protein
LTSHLDPVEFLRGNEMPKNSYPDLPRLSTGPRPVIEVTEDIITNATQGDSSHCMIADAIAAQIPGAKNVSVDLATIRWSDRKKGERYVFLTPPDAQDALVRFDQGQPVEPIAFRLRAAQVTRIKAAGRPEQARRTEERERYYAEKEANGEELTAQEKRGRALLGVKQGPERPTTAGAVTVTDNGRHNVVREGGNLPPTAVLSNTKGRSRVYGMRSLRPPAGPATIGIRIVDQDQ